MSDSEDPTDWSKMSFEGSRREQLRRFRALSLREKLEALEGMAAVARRFEQLRRDGAFRSQDPRTGGNAGRADNRVSESEAPNTFTHKGKPRT